MRAIKNIASLGSISLTNAFLPIFIIPYVIKVIGIESYGEVMKAMAYILLINNFVDFGYKISGPKLVLDNCNKSWIFSQITFSKLYLLFSSFFIVLILSVINLISIREFSMLLVLSPFVLGNLFSSDWLYHSLNKIHILSIVNFFAKILFVISILIFIEGVDDGNLFALFYGLSFFLPGVAAFLFILIKYKIRLRYVGPMAVLRLTYSQKAIFLNTYVPNLYTNLAVVILGEFSGNFTVGVYTAMKKIIDLGVNFTSIISRAFYPLLLDKLSSTLTLKIIMIIFLMFFTGFSVLIGEVYFNYIELDYLFYKNHLYILLLGLIGVAMYEVYGINDLIISGKEVALVKITFSASLISLLFMLLMTNNKGLLGIVWGVTMARMIMGICSYYFSQFVYKSEL